MKVLTFAIFYLALVSQSYARQRCLDENTLAEISKFKAAALIEQFIVENFNLENSAQEEQVNQNLSNDLKRIAMKEAPLRYEVKMKDNINAYKELKKCKEVTLSFMCEKNKVVAQKIKCRK